MEPVAMVFAILFGFVLNMTMFYFMDMHMLGEVQWESNAVIALFGSLLGNLVLGPLLMGKPPFTP